MKTFEIKQSFLVDNVPTTIMSGAIHYFRIPRSQWEDSLYNLKAIGANTVETYIPWNIHEPMEGTFDFSAMKDIATFIQLAEQEGLMVILRPSVYICAEWEFGGLPAWLLRDKNLRVRSNNEQFMQKVEHYFAHLLPKLVPFQVTHGGPVIMMQIENEYGSYGADKSYLRATKALMEKYGIDVPLFTADGAWDEVLDAGTLIEDDVFVAGNFGSHAQENTQVLQTFMQNHGKQWPLMCMEFWDGWFNRWGEAIIRREASDLAADVAQMLDIGSINLYMFHGGTNFGFYNGCSVRDFVDLPQITSYDYDAILSEWGEPTEKFYALQKVIAEKFPMQEIKEPRYKPVQAYEPILINGSTSLLENKERIVAGVRSGQPLRMEEIGSGYGYILYEATLKNYHKPNKMRIVEASDRLQVYVNQKYLLTQEQEQIGEGFELPLTAGETINIQLLIENTGRVNYGYKLNSPTQSKGIRGGVFYDIHFHEGFTNYPLDFNAEQLALLDFTTGTKKEHPSFYRATCELSTLHHTFIDCSAYGKGVIFVNGINLGRYWSKGPVAYLYCPADFLKLGQNEIIIFETEGREITQVTFSDRPVYISDQ